MNDSYSRGLGQAHSQAQSQQTQGQTHSESANPSPHERSGRQRPQSAQDLVRYVVRGTGLDEATATRVVADIVAYFGQTVEEFVRQRHEQLKSRNYKNDDIWPLILDELSYRRFKADDLTPRQLRRIVYG